MHWKPAATLSILTLILSGLVRGEEAGTPIEPGDVVLSAISGPDDTDGFLFPGSEGGVFDASVKAEKGSGLDPQLALVGPGETPVPLGPYTRAKTGQVQVKKVPLPTTGTYRLVVSGADGTTGKYELKTKGKPSKGSKDEGEGLDPGETHDIVFPGTGGAVASFQVKPTVKGAEIGVIDLLDPDETSVTGWQAFVTVKNGRIKGKVPLVGRFGDYTLRIGNSTRTTGYQYRTKVKFPKPAKRLLRLAGVVMEDGFSVNGTLSQVRFKVYDDESRDVDVRVQYSTDGGGSWMDATPQEGQTNPVTIGGSSAGHLYTFLWEMIEDLGVGFFEDVLTRATPESPPGDMDQLALGDLHCYGEPLLDEIRTALYADLADNGVLDSFWLVDNRTQQEFDQWSLPGARFLDAADVTGPGGPSFLPVDLDHPLVFFCYGGT